MANPYKLTKEQEEEYQPKVQAFLDDLDNMTNKEIETSNEDKFKLDLFQSKISPYLLKELLEKMGYEETETDTNGWQLDFWISMRNNNAKSDLTEKITIIGSGMYFQFELRIDLD